MLLYVTKMRRGNKKEDARRRDNKANGAAVAADGVLRK